MSNERAMQLEFNYAQINPATGKCIDVFTSSYQIPLPDEYILIPEFDISYRDKYYNASNGLWYHEAEFINEFIP